MFNQPDCEKTEKLHVLIKVILVQSQIMTYYNTISAPVNVELLAQIMVLASPARLYNV